MSVYIYKDNIDLDLAWLWLGALSSTESCCSNWIRIDESLNWKRFRSRGYKVVTVGWRQGWYLCFLAWHIWPVSILKLWWGEKKELVRVVRVGWLAQWGWVRCQRSLSKSILEPGLDTRTLDTASGKIHWFDRLILSNLEWVNSTVFALFEF